MKFAIRYYTRSGNTAKLADAISAAISVKAEPVSVALQEPVDVLLLGCSYYAFDMDAQVKAFIRENQGNIRQVALFGSSAMMKSMKKPMEKVLAGTAIKVLEQEFHCRGAFGPMHKGRPNEADLKAAADFAREIAGMCE